MIIVGGGDDGTYVVDTNLCGHSTSEPHNCVHDWRIVFGNVERTGGE